MKNNLSTLFATAAAACFFVSPLYADIIVDLVENGGNDDALVGGEISGWTEVSGTTWTQRATSPNPQAGSAYFNAGNNGTSFPDAYEGELAQTIDVSFLSGNIDAGLQEFIFIGYVSGWESRAGNSSDDDTAQIIVDYQNSSGGSLGSYDTGAANYNYHTDGWTQMTDTRFAPTGTRQIEISLIAERVDGTNNDGYFDSIQLRTAVIPEPSTFMLTGMGITMLLLRRRRFCMEHSA